ncbi:MAG TPA: Mrp/NBP35 family ATP-binding protein [Clostridiales bacterium]|nr:Mrp/NBP35 family ATP-binding protein [Clostridiales bacterium]
MSEPCDKKCGSCSKDCADRKTPQDFSAPANRGSNIKKVIGIVSGKGGVGKSLVSALLAVEMNRRGFNEAILDADVTGPSIPKAFGITLKAQGGETGLLPVVSRTGIRVMSVNLLLENETDPVVWRGPIIGNTVKQFWTDVAWGDVDYLFVDMPPGTGDVALTVFQSLPVDGVIIVASPQELVAMIVSKAVKMAEMMHIPVLGLVENMSYFRCPDCGKEYRIFGESRIEAVAVRHGLQVLASLPLDPALADACDNGAVEDYAGRPLGRVADIIEVSV